MSKKISPALRYVLDAWGAIPTSSWQRVNHGMYATLKNAVGSGMKFDPYDISKMPGTSHWLTPVGDEQLYSCACGRTRGDYNLSAAIAFEKWFKRKPWMWAEECKTPKRLSIGDKFTWEGQTVTITSFDDLKQTMVACTYKENKSSDIRPAPGVVDFIFDGYRKLEAYKEYEDGSICCRVSPKLNYQSTTIERRFTITHNEMQKCRKAFDKRKRDSIKAIANATTIDAIEAIERLIVGYGRASFRHFDIEELRAAYSARTKQIMDAMSETERQLLKEVRAAAEVIELERWKAGHGDRRFNKVCLRVKDGWVETSTGQRATLNGSKLAIKFALKYRNTGWRSTGAAINLDQFEIRWIDNHGVKVGCTLIPWAEIDRMKSAILK